MLTPLPMLDNVSTADPLAATRAQALRALTCQNTTSDLARELDVTRPPHPMQAKALREAGLIVSQRDDKARWHWCTQLGSGTADRWISPLGRRYYTQPPPITTELPQPLPRSRYLDDVPERIGIDEDFPILQRPPPPAPPPTSDKASDPDEPPPF